VGFWVGILTENALFPVLLVLAVFYPPHEISFTELLKHQRIRCMKIL